VWLDDGKIGGTIDRVDNDEIALTVTDVRPGGANLRAGKGINLPETDLQIEALTLKARDDLTFVVGHDDVVNVRSCGAPRMSRRSKPSCTASAPTTSAPC
jgi:pyruvate kinase